MKAITKFAAEDGTEFNTEAEALAHDASLQAEKNVDAYLDSVAMKGANRTKARNAILGYLGYAAPKSAE
jgi:hypothetical protein